MKTLTPQQKEQLANDIFNWLVDHKLWIDVHIYFNGICWSTSNKDNTEFCYNERKYFEYKANPKNYFDYVAEPNILSMSFESGLYDVLNGYTSKSSKLEAEFLKLFEKYNVYYELGNAWNLTCYEI